MENYQSGIAPNGAITAGKVALFSAAFALQRELTGMPSLNKHHQTRLEAPERAFRLYPISGAQKSQKVPLGLPTGFWRVFDRPYWNSAE